MDSTSPTISHGPSAAPPPAPAERGALGQESFADSSVNVSRAAVGMVAGDAPNFTDETAALLRERLTASALVISVLLAVAFVSSLIKGMYEWWWFRALILMVVLQCWRVIAGNTPLKMAQLRILELLLFGLVALQVSLMMITRIEEFMRLDDAISLVSAKQQILLAWCALIVTYGTFMPNTWQRATAILVPLAFFPDVLFAILCWLTPQLAVLSGQDQATMILPFPLVVALISIASSHITHATRREAYHARKFGQYRLLDCLGVGGMGEVYRAEHVLLKRQCAIKLIKPDHELDAQVLARFEAEVKATAKLTHWNTVEVYDYGRTTDGTFYYVMELLPGLSLETLASRHGPLPPERVIHFLRQVCGALSEAHNLGLIHRDIKPANIFAAQRGGMDDVIKLLDFGLVKVRAGEANTSSERRGSFSGTPQYMAPEQASAYEDVDGRADLYSLGAVGYFLLTGQPPFTHNNVMEL